MSVWTPENEKRLARLADGTRSAHQIALALGVTRNAIIGKLLRSGGALGRLRGERIDRSRKRKDEGALPAQIKRERQRAAKAATPACAAPVPAVPEPDLPIAIALDPSRLAHVPLSFLKAATQGRCLFFWCEPMSADGPDLPVCGRPRAEGQTRYCRDCNARAAAPRVEKRSLFHIKTRRAA